MLTTDIPIAANFKAELASYPLCGLRGILEVAWEVLEVVLAAARDLGFASVKSISSSDVTAFLSFAFIVSRRATRDLRVLSNISPKVRSRLTLSLMRPT